MQRKKTGKVAFVADVHIGNHKLCGGPVVNGVNDRARRALYAFREACSAAISSGCEALVVLGDLFDTSNPIPQLITEVQIVLKDAKNVGLYVIIMVGNHDMVSEAEGDHALGPLRPFATIIDRPSSFTFGEPFEEVELWLAPFRSGDQMANLVAAFDSCKRDEIPFGSEKVKRVLGAHVGIQNDQTPFYLLGSKEAIDETDAAALLARYNAQAFVCGNWHNRYIKVVDTTKAIVQCGALCPTGWDNPGHEGYGKVTTVSYNELPNYATIRNVPFFYAFKLDQAKHMRGKEISWPGVFAREGQEPTSFFRIDAPADRRAEAQELIDFWVFKNRIVRGYVSLVGMTKEERGKVVQAGTAVRNPLAIDAAIERYIETHPLPESLNVEDFGSTLRRLLTTRKEGNQ